MLKEFSFHSENLTALVYKGKFKVQREGENSLILADHWEY